jgi:predicted nucleotidyltransferase
MQNFVKQTILRLADAEVEFVVVGGMSAVLQGVPVVTLDLDVCYRRTPENIARLAQALAPLQPRLRGLPPDLPAVFDERSLSLGTNFTLLVSDEAVDLLADMSAIGGYEQIIGEAKTVPIEGRSVKVLSLRQLIATKTAAGRPKDLLALPYLTEAFDRERKPPSP